MNIIISFLNALSFFLAYYGIMSIINQNINGGDIMSDGMWGALGAVVGSIIAFIGSLIIQWRKDKCDKDSIKDRVSDVKERVSDVRNDIILDINNSRKEMIEKVDNIKDDTHIISKNVDNIEADVKYLAEEQRIRNKIKYNSSYEEAEYIIKSNVEKILDENARLNMEMKSIREKHAEKIFELAKEKALAKELMKENDNLQRELTRLKANDIEL